MNHRRKRKYEDDVAHDIISAREEENNLPLIVSNGVSSLCGSIAGALFSMAYRNNERGRKKKKKREEGQRKRKEGVMGVGMCIVGIVDNVINIISESIENRVSMIIIGK